MNTPVWVVKEVVPQENYSLLLTFADGSKRIYNARPLLNKAIFADLRQYRTIRRQRWRCLFRHLLLAEISIYLQ